MKKEKLAALVIITLLMSATLVAFVKATHPQNDAGQPGDAGNSARDARSINSGYLYNGTLYGPNEEDMEDYYNVTAYNGHWINITMTPPPNVDFHMQLKNPTGAYKAGSYRGPGELEIIKYRADMDGNWTIIILVNSTADEGQYSFYIEPINSPPQKPSTPLGNSLGYVYTEYTYISCTTDVNNDNIKYTFFWGDGTSSTAGPYSSGINASATHQWKRPITYDIMVQATDEHGLLSDFSDIKSVTLCQNDANSGGDAGNSFSNSLFILPNTYKGTVYPPELSDTVDYYKFTVGTGERIKVTMTPPSDADFQLELYNPNQDIVNASYRDGFGLTEEVTYLADLSGNWSIRISRWKGEGQYVFTLSITHHTLTVKTCTTTGSGITNVKVWIDGAQYYSPITVELSLGTHTVEVQSHFWRGWFEFTFVYWEDNSVNNPRSIYFDGIADITITAYYMVEYYGTCPTLFVWNGTDYAEEGLLNIHAESDITVQHKIEQTLAPKNHLYNLELRELDDFTSHIDQVKLFAVDSEGRWHLCPLIYAKHGNSYVTLKLLFDDNKRIDLAPSETVSLKFLPSIPYKNTMYFIFEINGYNKKIP